MCYLQSDCRRQRSCRRLSSACLELHRRRWRHRSRWVVERCRDLRSSHAGCWSDHELRHASCSSQRGPSFFHKISRCFCCPLSAGSSSVDLTCPRNRRLRILSLQCLQNRRLKHCTGRRAARVGDHVIGGHSDWLCCYMFLRSEISLRGNLCDILGFVRYAAAVTATPPRTRSCIGLDEPQFSKR